MALPPTSKWRVWARIR